MAPKIIKNDLEYQAALEQLSKLMQEQYEPDSDNENEIDLLLYPLCHTLLRQFPFGV